MQPVGQLSSVHRDSLGCNTRAKSSVTFRLGASGKANEAKTAASELDELFGSIGLASGSKPSATEPDDCLPLFSTASSKPANPSANESAAVKRGGLFDDLQDLLVDQSTGHKISSNRRYVPRLVRAFQ